MKKSGKRSVLFVFLLALLFVSMAGIVSAFVRINEIMYNPTAEQGGDANVEWVELYNNGTTTVNLADWTIDGSNFDDYNITAGEYLIVVDKVNGTNSFEEWWGNNDTVWNSTDGNYNVIDGTLSLDDNEDAFNITNGTYLHVVQYLDDWGGDDNGKTLIFYKGTFTESGLANGTPGASNDQFAPDFNKWLKPSKNNSIVSDLLNISVNITDAANVSSVLVDFNNTNYSMSQNNDLRYRLWNTSQNADGEYNITIFFNDSLGFSNTDTLFNIAVDNANPKIYNPATSANSRNFIAPRSVFNASVNVTDSNLLNVTCTLNGAAVGYFNSDENAYYCNLTAPQNENDFEITFTAIDKLGNTNSTILGFTTKYATSAQLVVRDIKVSDLGQSDKAVQVNATLENKGNNPIYDAGITLIEFSSSKLSPAPLYQRCGGNISAGKTCNATFNISVAGGTIAETTTIFWNANWTDNNLTKKHLSAIATSKVIIENNAKIAAADNISAVIIHGKNSTLKPDINSTGNTELQSVNATFIEGTLKASWLNITSAKFASIGAGSGESIPINIAVPKHTSPGNYSGTIRISASNGMKKNVWLIIEVPRDDQWTTYPKNIITYANSNNAGIAGTFILDNSGNIGHNYSISPDTSSNFFFNRLWDSSNPTSVYAEAGASQFIRIYHLPMKDALPSISRFDLEITIKSENTSRANNTFISLVRDDNNPGINITSPLNNSFVKGDVMINVNASDLNLSRIEFYINSNLVFNDESLIKKFNWTTKNGSYPDNIYELKAVAYDSAGNYNASKIKVIVNNTDSAPIVENPLVDFSFDEDTVDSSINLKNVFSDIDGKNLEYNSSVNTTALGILIDQNTGIAALTPKGNWTGAALIKFNATGTGSNYAPDDVAVTIKNVQDAPTVPLLQHPKNNSISKKSSAAWIELDASSIDADYDNITFLFYFSNDSDNLPLAGTAICEYSEKDITPGESKQCDGSLQIGNLAPNTTYYWRVSAFDGVDNSGNSSIFQFYHIKDTAPQITSWVWNTSSKNSTNETKITIAENMSIHFKANIADLDGDAMSYEWGVCPIGYDVACLAEIGNIAGQAVEYSYTPSFSDAGTRIVTLTITDNNTNSAIQEWNLTIKNTNNEPVLDAITDKSVLEDSILTFNITAFDPDNDSLSFSSNISGMAFAKAANSSMATASWTPTNGNVGNNLIKFIVSDGTKTGSKTAIITVANTNDAPIITDFFPKENKTIAANVGEQRFNVTPMDVDVDDVGSLEWFINGASLDGTENITIGKLSRGVYNVTFITRDALGASARQEWKLAVTTNISSDELTSPVLELNDTERQSAKNVTISQSASGGIDFGDNALNFSGVVALEDAFNISRGLISVNTEKFPGLNKSASLSMKGLNFTKMPLIFMAHGFESIANAELCPDSVCTNKAYDSADKILRFSVAHFTTFFAQANTTNGAPIITSAPITAANDRSTYRYDVDATDPDEDTLSFSLIASPSGMGINSNTGLISWKPANSQLGLHNVTVIVSDGNLTSNQSFEVNAGKGPRLAISGLDAKIDGKATRNIQNNTKIGKKAKPGSKIELNLEIENTFTREEDLKIEGIDAQVIIEGIGDHNDMEKDSDEFSLKAGRKEDVKMIFDIPLEVDEGAYSLIIDAEGKDENRIKHGISFMAFLEVKKDNHEIRVIRSDLAPSTIQCQRNISLNTEIINTGSKDEDDVSLEIVSPELGINSVEKGIILDESGESNRFSKMIKPSISPDVLPGTYSIMINTYYGDKLSGTKTVGLDVQECELKKEITKEVREEKPKVEIVNPITVKERQKPAPVEVSFAKTSKHSLLPLILITLFIGTFVFIIGAAFIIIKK